MTDHEIIDLYWDRNEEAITATAKQYGAYCHTIAYNILHIDEDAEECVNDTWLGAWKAMPPQRPNRLATFLGKITRNLSIDRFRRYNTGKRGQGQMILALAELEDCVPGENSVEQAAEDKMLVESINRFLNAQQPQRRNIFIRRYWYLYPLRDISAVYGMNERRIASLLFRMRNELREHLEKEGIQL